MAKTFGENLRRIRTRKGITQETLMVALGLRRPAPISLWESRATLPRPDTIVRLEQALGCDPRELLDGVETPYDRLRAGKSLESDADFVLDRFTGERKRANSA